MPQAKAPVAAAKRGSRDVPERIGKYVIINEVGQGSTGRVFLSHDPYYGRDVAIKLYNIENEEDEQKARVTRKMFFNEAQMMGRLQHRTSCPSTTRARRTAATTSSPSTCTARAR